MQNVFIVTKLIYVLIKKYFPGNNFRTNKLIKFKKNMLNTMHKYFEVKDFCIVGVQYKKIAI